MTYKKTEVRSQKSRERKFIPHGATGPETIRLPRWGHTIFVSSCLSGKENPSSRRSLIHNSPRIPHRQVSAKAKRNLTMAQKINEQPAGPKRTGKLKDPAWTWAPYKPTDSAPWNLAKAAHLYRRAALDRKSVG